MLAVSGPWEATGSCSEGRQIPENCMLRVWLWECSAMGTWSVSFPLQLLGGLWRRGRSRGLPGRKPVLLSTDGPCGLQECSRRDGWDVGVVYEC